MTDAIAAFESVSKSYRSGFLMRRTPVLKQLSFQVEQGSVCGLLGPNGAGKTTTLRLLLGLIRPDAGRIRVAGSDPGSVLSRRSLGFLPENPSFYDYLSGREFMDLSGRLAGLDAAGRRLQTKRAAERVGLADVLDRQLRKYSKGMLQRLAMGQALLGEPELLVLDEPMSGLDPIGRRLLRDIILEERQRGASVLFSSHILQDAELICDRVIILVGGRLRSVGRLDEMLASQVGHYELSVENLGTTVSSLPGEATELAREGPRVLLRVADLEGAEAVARAATEGGGRLLGMVPVRMTLEDLVLGEIAHGEDR